MRDKKGRFKKGCRINLGRERLDMINNKFCIGRNPWNKGKTGIYTNEYREKLKKAHLGKRVSNQTKEKLSIVHKGKRHTEEAIRKMSTAARKRVVEGRHNFYKGGVTPLIRQIRKCFKYNIWRENIFKRDNYICVFCNVKGGWNKILKKKIILHVDHIYPFSLIFYENKIKTFEEALLCKKFWNINNGRTLCKNCHKKTFNYGVNINV